MSFRADGTKLIMTRGDYGIPVPIRVKQHCERCRDNLLDEDQIILQVYRGPCVKVERSITWSELRANEGVMELSLTEAESASLLLGVYYWRVVWYRPDEICNTLFRSVLEVEV